MLIVDSNGPVPLTVCGPSARSSCRAPGERSGGAGCTRTAGESLKRYRLIPQPFLGAVRSDVEVISLPAGQTPEEVLAAVRAQHTAAGNPPPRSIAIWQGIPPKPESDELEVEIEEPEPDAKDGDEAAADPVKVSARAAAKAKAAAAKAAAEAAEAERIRLAYLKLREDTEALCAGLASLMPSTGA